jgi:hypothetical protein
MPFPHTFFNGADCSKKPAGSIADPAGSCFLGGKGGLLADVGVFADVKMSRQALLEYRHYDLGERRGLRRNDSIAVTAQSQKTGGSPINHRE